MAARSPSYGPRRPVDSLLYRIVREHWETFRAEAGRLRDGDGLPAFVEDEFRNFLRCGWLAGGFARFRCGGCGAERLVAFSCKSSECAAGGPWRVWASRAMSQICPTDQPNGATPGGTGSIWTPAMSSQRGHARGSNDCAGTS